MQSVHLPYWLLLHSSVAQFLVERTGWCWFGSWFGVASCHGFGFKCPLLSCSFLRFTWLGVGVLGSIPLSSTLCLEGNAGTTNSNAPSSFVSALWTKMIPPLPPFVETPGVKGFLGSDIGLPKFMVVACPFNICLGCHPTTKDAATLRFASCRNAVFPSY